MSTNDPSLKDYFEAGYAHAKLEHLSSPGLYVIGADKFFEDRFGYYPKGSTPTWRAFVNGQSKFANEERAELRAKYRVDELISRLRAVLAEYDASIALGDGGELQVKGKEFEANLDPTIE